MSEIRIGVSGATGRMGAAVIDAAREADGVTVSGALVRAGQEGPSSIEPFFDLEAFVGSCDVIIDFSRPELLTGLISACIAAHRPLVSGTTGLDEGTRAALADAAGRLPIVHAPNMSIGINILMYLVEIASETLGSEWTCRIAEAHHRHKVDAPSGTALQLGDKAARRKIEYQVRREGEIIGEHQVHFDGPGERVTLAHEALDRAIFARGALAAARWIVAQPPGLYGMAEVLGLKSA